MKLGDTFEAAEPAVGSAKARARWRGYVIAVAATAAVVLLRWVADPLLGHYLIYAPLLGAVAIAVWQGGWRPALVSVVLGVLACDYLFVEPRGRLAINTVDDFAAIGIYLLTCSIVIGFGEAMRLGQRQAEEGRERLRTTLASIGDAFIATDTEGRVTMMNAVAESLTGWKYSEAVGQPIDAVFRIVNEQTRQTVENPVNKVLKLGRIVGLANHTVLIAKDGTEHAIDDSAAPIRCKEGQIVGCVLIFRDISDRREAEASLRDSESRLRLALEAGRMGTWEWRVARSGRPASKLSMAWRQARSPEPSMPTKATFTLTIESVSFAQFRKLSSTGPSTTSSTASFGPTGASTGSRRGVDSFGTTRARHRA